jgi:hypothetical protein
VGFFRRREPLHQRLAREGGLTPSDPRPAWQETGIHGIPRAREWDTTLTADGPDIDANAVRWVGLPDGTILVEDGPNSSLESLAIAVEEKLEPPYRARAARQVGDVWAVQATRLEVIALPDAPAGDTIDVARNGATTTVIVEGREIVDSVPELEERGAREGAAYAVRAERLDGALFEVQASAL